VPKLIRPLVEQHIEAAADMLKMAPERDVKTLEDEIVAALDANPEIVVNKARRLRRSRQMLEITANWMGLDATGPAMQKALLDTWPREQDDYGVSKREDAAELVFLSSISETHFVSGRILLIL
jgi:hypothetical protein